MHALVRKSSFSKAQGLRETGSRSRAFTILFNSALALASVTVSVTVFGLDLVTCLVTSCGIGVFAVCLSLINRTTEDVGGRTDRVTGAQPQGPGPGARNVICVHQTRQRYNYIV